MKTTKLDSGSGGSDPPTPVWLLAIVGHRDPSRVGARVPLSRGEPLLLGRDQTAFGANAFEDDRISRQHARIELTEDRVEIVDLGSRNGTLVNESRVERARVRDGDVIRLGTVVLIAYAQPAIVQGIDDRDLVGLSHSHHAMMARLIELAPRSTTLVIEGETGTGKRLVAEAVHRHSQRTGAFVTLYCGALADTSLPNELFGHLAGAFAGATEDRVGLLESADGGTLLLDGVDEASDEMQALLLEFLESRGVRRIGAAEATPVDVRLLAASRAPLADAVAAGAIRREFGERLGKITLRVPPLRSRRIDIGPLAALFAERFVGAPRPLHHRLVAALAMHDWPGNVRELEGVIELAVIDAGDSDEVKLTAELAGLLSFDGADGLERPNLEPTPAGVLVVAQDGRWFEPPGKQAVDLGQRPNLARLMAALARNHRDAPDSALSVPELLELGWPGERVIERAGANRVYVALTTLRKLGLRDWIARTRQGYRIPPEIRVVIRA